MKNNEIARKMFVSLIKVDSFLYAVLNDGYFIENICAKNETEAIKKFNQYLEAKNL